MKTLFQLAGKQVIKHYDVSKLTNVLPPYIITYLERELEELRITEIMMMALSLGQQDINRMHAKLINMFTCVPPSVNRDCEENITS